MGIHQVMASRTLGGPTRHKTVLDSSESIVFWCSINHSFIYLLVLIVSLGSIRLYIIVVGTIAQRRSIEDYVTLY